MAAPAVFLAGAAISVGCSFLVSTDGLSGVSAHGWVPESGLPDRDSDPPDDGSGGPADSGVSVEDASVSDAVRDVRDGGEFNVWK
jgi:hypothetical protein